MNNCTWEGCDEPATHPQTDIFDEQWANLCQTHHDMLAGALDEGNTNRVMHYWLKAQGGAEAAAARM